jgi:hypothetical protein
MRGQAIYTTVAIALLLSLVGCEELPREPAAALATYESLSPNVQATMDALGAADYVTALAAGVQAEYAQATAQAARLTSDAAWVATTAQAQLEADHATQTVAAWSFQATQTAVARADESTATAQVEGATATAAARATATYQAGLETTATAQASATAVAVAHAGQTAQAAPTLTVVALELRTAERRNRQAAVVDVSMWVGIAVSAVVLGWLGYRAFEAWELRRRTIPRDERGDAPIVVHSPNSLAWLLYFLANWMRRANVPLPPPGTIYYDPDRGWGPATTMNDLGQVEAPQLVPPEYQERTTARDQYVDLRTRGQPQPRRTARQATPRFPTSAFRPGAPPTTPGFTVRVVPPSRVRPWLEEVEGQLVLTAGEEDDDG